MTRVAGDLGNFLDLFFFCLFFWTFFGPEFLGGRKLGPSDVLGRTHYPLQCLAVGGRAVAIPGGDATSQNALDGADASEFKSHMNINCSEETT